MFSKLPVERSSMMKTSSPRSRQASERCEPIKPAPPVIRTRNTETSSVILGTRSESNTIVALGGVKVTRRIRYGTGRVSDRVVSLKITHLLAQAVLHQIDYSRTIWTV